MPLTYNRTFRVRHYECDAYGHVNNANYLRYMQETAFDASTAVGYAPARYADMGRRWLARQTEVEYIRPLRYGDTVQVKTWVESFRRVMVHRRYEFHCNGELCATAYTDWAFLDIQTGKPVSIPHEMVIAFIPDRQPDISRRERFSPAPSPPPGVFSMRRRVTWQDIGQGQHVNNAVYLSYVNDCGIQVAAAFGWPVERMMAENFAIIVRKHQIEYLQPALLDDELEIATWVSDVKRATAIRHYTMTRVSGGLLIAQAHTLYVWVDIAFQKPIRIPPQFLADFAPNIV